MSKDLISIAKATSNDDIQDDGNKIEYTDEFKAELDRRYEYYKNGGKMITAQDAEEQIAKILRP